MFLLITDLDNTLYDWVTFYAKSFQAMLTSLAELLSVDESTLQEEFKHVHQRYGNSEQPYAALELPSVKAKFGYQSRSELAVKLEVPFHRFNSERKKLLKLYDGVGATLEALSASGVTVVGHTESIWVNGFYRLQKLDIVRFFERLYVRQGRAEDHPVPARGGVLDPPEGFLVPVNETKRKPNPDLLLDICRTERIDPDQTCYVGDSLLKDIAMAKSAGVTAVWAKYGTNYDPSLWKILVRITHWTDDDVKREEELGKRFEGIRPDYAIDSFSELLPIFGFDATASQNPPLLARPGVS